MAVNIAMQKPEILDPESKSLNTPLNRCVSNIMALHLMRSAYANKPKNLQIAYCLGIAFELLRQCQREDSNTYSRLRRIEQELEQRLRTSRPEPKTPL